MRLLVILLAVLLAWGQPSAAWPPEPAGIRLEPAEWVPKFGTQGAWIVTAAGGREAVGKSGALDPIVLPAGKYDVYWQQDWNHAQVLVAAGVEVKEGLAAVPLRTGINLEAAEWVPKFGTQGAWVVTAAGGREAVDKGGALDPIVLPAGKYDVYWQQDWNHAQVLVAGGVEVKDGLAAVPLRAGIRFDVAEWVPKFGTNGGWVVTASGGREAVDKGGTLDPIVLPAGTYDVYWRQDWNHAQALVARGVEVKEGLTDVPLRGGIRLDPAEWVPKSSTGWVAKNAGGEEIIDRTGVADPMLLPAGKYDVYWQRDPNSAQVPVARGVEVKESLSAVPVATGLRLDLGGWAPHNAIWVVTEAGGREVIDKNRAPDPMVLLPGKYDVHSQEAAVSTVVEGVAVKPGELTVVPWPAGVKAKQDRQPKGLPGVGLKGEDVNRAIDRGSEFLWKYLKAEDLGKGGMKLGEHEAHALVCLALVHSNAHRRFADFDAALRESLGRVSPYKDLAAVHPATYKVGVLCMLVESYADSTYLPRLREGARYLLEAQGPGGSWGYDAPNVVARGDAFFRDIDARDDSAPKDDATAERWKRVGPWEDGTDGDTSVTQFGTLGLHAASRMKIAMPVETWERNLATYRGRQNMDGGFTYSVAAGSGESYGSMTCAGICGIALCRHHLGESDPAIDPSIEQGLSWLSRNFSVTTNPGHDLFNYYYLYSVERVGRILDTEFIGEHEWYPLGAKELVSSQQADGRWTGASEDARVATSFALLFLTRATPRLKPEPEKEKEEEPVVKEEKPVVKEKPAPPVEKPKELKPATIQVVDRAEGPEAGDRRGPAAVLLVLDCSSSMDAKVDGNKKYRVARDVIRGLVHDAPDSMQVGLRIFGHNDADTSEMVWPMGPLSPQRRQELEALLPKLKPYGRTPMVRALLDARHDLDGVRQPGGKYIILIGDGKETSGGRMESVRDAYRGADVELVLHVVGFDVQGKGMAEDRRQLQEAAKVTGGKYYDARNAKELADALRAATYVPRPTEFEILDARGTVIRTGKVNDPPLQLPEGTYQIRLVGAGKPVAIQVVPGKPLALTVDELQGHGR